MAHYAKGLNGIVQKVIVAEPEFFETFVDDSPGKWIQTSYNTSGGIHYDPETRIASEDQSKALRKNYASVGFIYDKTLDAFYEPQPYPSWSLNTETCFWEPPVPRPDDGDAWDEENQIWITYTNGN